tara:strand:+ start:2686 stop:3807 length:1122 start_codon:yes stop_codon:yes gene_type:complete
MEKPKNILIINPWTEKIGPNTFLKSLVNGLVSDNSNITILYPCEDSFSIELKNIGCKILYVHFLKSIHSNSFLKKSFIYIFKELSLLFFLLFKFKTKKYDNIIINSELFSFSLFGISKKPNSFIVVHALSFTKSRIFKTLIFNIQNLTIKKYIAVSKIVKTNLRNNGVKKNIILCYNGVDLKIFSNNNNNKSNRPIKLISIIHPVPVKGAHHLILTLSQLKRKGINFNCLILGWGDNPVDEKYKLKIKNLVKQHKLQDFVSFIKSINVVNNLMNSDILIHPSESESFGYVLAEALALKIPVVAFEVGAISEIVDNNFSGFLVKPFSVIEMSNAVIRLIRSKKMRLEFGSYGLIKVEKFFDSKKNIKKLINEHF